jgi:glycoside/pentoside/hexuronide:cation symporter, GPH family
MTAEAVALPPAVPADRRLSLGTKLFYGFGSVAFGVKDNGFSYLLLLFYNQVIGLPVTLVGLAAMIALLWDACIDPLIGQLSDNLHSRWGRRHPFMYAAALPVALCYMALWNPPHWSHQALFYYLIVTAIVIRTFISFYEVPSSALAAEFSANYDERSELLSYRYFFGWVGGLALNFIAFFFLFTPDKTHKVGQLNPVGYAHYGMVGAAVMFVAILISAAGTHRYIPTLMRPPPRRHLTLRKTVHEMGETLSNRSFLFLLLSGIATAMAAGLGASLNNYFNTFFWEFSARQISLFTAGVFLSAIIALPAAPLLSRRYGKRATAIALMALSLAVGLTPLLLRLADLMPPNHSTALVAIIFCTSIVGTALGIISSTMLSSMIADVVEAAELKTGRRSEGLFFAASTFVGKAVSGFGILGASLIVEFIHLQSGANPDSVPPAVVRNLALVYCPVMIGLYAVALVLLTGYKITRATHLETLRLLEVGAAASVVVETP